MTDAELAKLALVAKRLHDDEAFSLRLTMLLAIKDESETVQRMFTRYLVNSGIDGKLASVVGLYYAAGLEHAWGGVASAIASLKGIDAADDAGAP